jgi:xylulokinase
MDSKVYTLGIDFGTQSVKSVILDVYNAEVIHTDSFEYDYVFPVYRTQGGVLPNDNLDIRHTSPFMLIQALDTTFTRLHAGGINAGCIKGVKIDAMQHCTVYADTSFGNRVMALEPDRELLPQLESSITRKTSPIWEDRSATEEVNYLTNALEKNDTIQFLTGNKAELRFPAAQILKWAKQSPDEYRWTAYIFLLSSFLTSILAGKIAPVDTGDGWGTNLNNLSMDRPGWNDIVLEIADAYLRNRGEESPLRDKLVEMVHYDTVIGGINPYFIQRYGVNPEAVVLAGTGDNPATLLGSGGHTVISLGSSYTVNGVMPNVTPSLTGEYNVFGYIPGKAMAITVITNGAKVHEFLLKKYIEPKWLEGSVEEKWEAYIAAAGDVAVSENEKLMLPYLLDESVPVRRAGIVRDDFNERDAGANIRALHISQALSLYLHSRHLYQEGEICLVGGAARNRFLRQLIADVFDTGSYSIQHAGYAACLGCAVSCGKVLLQITYEEAVERYVRVDRASSVVPLKQNRPAIQTLLHRYEALENSRKT